MDRDFFLNAGPHLEPTSEMPSWKLISVPEQSPLDRFNNFEPALSSVVSNSVSPNDSFTARELIGKLGSMGNGGGEVSPAAMASSDPYNTWYIAPLNSPPPKLNWPSMDQLVKGNMPNLRFSPNLPSLAADPGFAERAAKFSCFGSRSFNGRTSQLGFNSNNNSDLQFRSSDSPLMGNAKLCRVSSSPALQIDGSVRVVQENIKSTQVHMRNDDNKTTSNEESSVSEQMEIGLKNPNDSNSRKRKAASSKGKAKEIASSTTVKEEENDSKKPKKREEDANVETEKKPKLAEPPKDYIHVRARRGQATDSHSLAERVRREKISERMKLLQDLVPGCNKVTGKALMLDEIINYVQSLQHQVEFLSMKLAAVPPRQDFDINSHLSKDMNQLNGNLSHQLCTMEASTPDFYLQNPQVVFIGSAPITQSPVDPLPPVHEFTDAFSQFTGFEGDDLHCIVNTGLGENHNPEMKIEL